MKISLNWLKEYIDIQESPEELSQLLTHCGLEVEVMEPVYGSGVQLDGLVVGHVVECAKHPNADKLSVTRVDIGGNELLKIVCGAPNVATGQKVVVAKVGTTLNTAKGELTLSKLKIRGEESEGMICAEDEIGLGNSHEGIIVLDNAAVIGSAVGEYLGAVKDYTFEIGLTPNRADAISHTGVARDVAAVLSLKNPVKIKMPSVESFLVDNNDKVISVIIEDQEACPRYCGITISGITVGESPVWLKERLMAIGLHPINNVVDVTNFILHELGQPLHAFDADEIEGGKVIIKKLKEGTKFFTLDNVERTLTSGDLMICNASEPMCMAGVYGGVKSGVSEKTKNIFIESAYFNPVTIRKSSKHHRLKTDASFRFERGANPDILVYALQRAALLVKEICGGKISSPVIDEYPAPIKPFVVEFSMQGLTRIAGCDIAEDVVRKILHALEIKIVSENAGIMQLHVPPYRVDVKREVDVAEEILRIFGYNNIPMPGQMRISVGMSNVPDKEKMLNRVSEQLVTTGFSEIWCNSLTSENHFEGLDSVQSSNAVHLKNPLSKDLGIMRQTMLFGGLEVIAFNQNRKNPNLKIFEYGKCYHVNPNVAGGNALEKYSETEHLAIWVTGAEYQESWNTKDDGVDFYFLKNMLMNVFSYSGIKNISIQKIIEKKDVFDIQYRFVTPDGKHIAEVGMVSSSVLKRFDIKRTVWFADINWTRFVALASETKIRFSDIPKFPEVRRDLALLLDRNISFDEIIKATEQIKCSLIRDVNLFDVYEGEKLPVNKKSYAVSFHLRDDEKTLSDDEIDKIMNNLIVAFKEKLGATLR